MHLCWRISLRNNLTGKSWICSNQFWTFLDFQADFVREYNYSFFLSPHPNIIDTYEGMCQTKDESAFFFVQEICPYTSLRKLIELSQSGEWISFLIMTIFKEYVENSQIEIVISGWVNLFLLEVSTISCLTGCTGY